MDNFINTAKALAEKEHATQQYGTYPYMKHINDVVANIKTVTNDVELIAAAYLHDIIEDTTVTYSDITQMFNTRIADLVWAVTGEGSSRTEQMASAIKKIAVTPGSELIKSADRLANATASKIENKMDLYQRYKNEHINLAPVLGNNALAQQLLVLFKE